jgi:hypothetical protein
VPFVWLRERDKARIDRHFKGVKRASLNTPWCSQQLGTSGLKCDLQRGHHGPHMCHFILNKIAAVWSETDSEPQS